MDQINKKADDDKSVTDIEITEKKSIKNYSEEVSTFLKIYTRFPTDVSKIKTIFEYGFTYGSVQFDPVTYESNMPYGLRFMIDTGIFGVSWIELKNGSYTIRSKSSRASNCQIEVDIKNYNDIECHPCEGPYASIAPLRILSFDIECASEKGSFPRADKDPVIQIANICKIQGQEQPFIRNVFVLGTCASIAGAEVIEFKTEEELLKAWVKFVEEVDPDMITGYNINNFDIPYIIERGNALKIHRFGRLSRLMNKVAQVKSVSLSSKQMGTHENKEVNLEGRVLFDMLQVILREHKLTSYTLNNVSYEFLKEQKEDVHHSMISELHQKNQYTRRRLAVYCIKDAYLPLRLMEKMMCLYNYSEMARVTGVPIKFLFTRGQQIKVTSQLYRKAYEVDMLIPNEKRATESGDKYEGATVIEPDIGYYTDPIATLDFASLYPSIMMAHNLCYSTLIPRDRVKNYKEDMYERTPHGDYFVKKKVHTGLLPKILEELLGARKQAKKELAQEKDPFMQAVLNGRQLALKISANSVYGFTGAQVGQLPCLEISSSVTSYGRQMIDATKKQVEETYNKKNGYEFDAHVIYGDTDSVMVKFGTKDIAESMKLGEEAAAEISKTFVKPIKLEFEKVYCPYLLMAKKKYAGLLYTNPEKYDKIDAKGIETVRRDCCGIVREVMSDVLKKVLIEKDKHGAVEVVKGVVSDLLQNRIDLSQLIITKELGKKTQGQEEEEQKANKKKGIKSKTESKNSYQSKLPHVMLADRMRKRDPATAPNVGDRVPYVIIKGSKNSKIYERSEDPLYVLENNCEIDYGYYLENQLKKPLIRIFEPILSNPASELFAGDHTRIIYKPKVQASKGAFGGFLKVKKTCMGCNHPVKNNEALCENCLASKGKKIYLERKLEHMRYQKSYGDLWVQCQRCQGSLHQDVICQNKDCPIFYKRVKSSKLLEESQQEINRFITW